MCVVCSYFKRLLDTMSRFLYIENAYKNLALWMKNGSEPVQKLKRFIHRNLALPAKMIHESIDQDEAQEYLMEFAHRYIDALLTYCSDILKPGALTNIRSLPRTATRTRTQQVISSCLPRRPKNSEIYPSERSVSTCM